jgi:hypothetical protein
LLSAIKVYWMYQILIYIYYRNRETKLNKTL